MQDSERHLHETLRPTRLDEYIGQVAVRRNLSVALSAAKKRKTTLEHVLVYGPPGLGKTTLATIIASELGRPLRTVAGPMIARPGDIASLLSGMEAGDVLFIDEIHRLPRAVEEMLYAALEDFELNIILGKGAGVQAIKLSLSPFTLVGATTRASALTNPLRDRFGHFYRLEFYSLEEIAAIIVRSARILGVRVNEEAINAIATRSRATPRVANRLLKRVSDYGLVHRAQTIDGLVARAALNMLDVDELGLNREDRQLLALIADHFQGGPVGIETIAAALHEEVETIEDLHEPYLMKLGLLDRTNRGRVVTRKAYNHLGRVPERLV